VTPDQILALAQGAGSGGDPVTATAVALAESGGNPAALGQNPDGSRDRGLWQVNDRAHPDVADACAFDPSCNAQAAYAISGGWQDFTPWTTFQTGAYRAFLQQAGTANQQPAPQSRSLTGQGVVGQQISSPWFPGSWEITQGWGPTSYGGEPEGHGYAHWHAGVDVGLDSGTTLTLPAGATGIARSLDNPDGYGTALVILVAGGPAILLGHLRQRLVDDGARVQPGDELATTDSTGNSTGPHLHFEVRPQDARRPLGMGAYGTDVDPSQWLIAGSGGPTQANLLAFDPGAGLRTSFQQALSTVLAGGQVLLGAALVIAGLVATAYGLRGEGPQQLQRDAGRAAKGLARPRPRPRPAGPQRQSGAAESRVRPDLQRQPGSGGTAPGRRPAVRGGVSGGGGGGTAR